MKRFLILLSILLSLSLSSQQIIPLDEKSYSDSLQNIIKKYSSQHFKSKCLFSTVKLLQKQR
ncbi:hypothetical protein HX13_02065 [Chryseobacterium sp. P1-3]|nr:hypothetical protein HX13_02065 [Chryseobacterium sp. P1-3]